MDRMKRKAWGRVRRHLRLRQTVRGTPERPRLSVFRSQKQMYVQIIDDTHSHTLAALSTRSAAVAPALPKNGANVAAAKVLGEQVAKLAKERGILKVVFDRGGYKYHGRVKAVADGARQGGLSF